MGEPAPTVQKIKNLVYTSSQTPVETPSTKENLGVYLLMLVLFEPNPSSKIIPVLNSPMKWRHHTGMNSTHSGKMHPATCHFAFDFTDIYIFATGADPFDEDLYPLTTGTNSKHYFRLRHLFDLNALFDNIIGEASTSKLCSFRPSCIFILRWSRVLDFCAAVLLFRRWRSAGTVWSSCGRHWFHQNDKVPVDGDNLYQGESSMFIIHLNLTLFFTSFTVQKILNMSSCPWACGSPHNVMWFCFFFNTLEWSKSEEMPGLSGVSPVCADRCSLLHFREFTWTHYRADRWRSWQK